MRRVIGVATSKDCVTKTRPSHEETQKVINFVRRTGHLMEEMFVKHDKIASSTQ